MLVSRRQDPWTEGHGHVMFSCRLLVTTVWLRMGESAWDPNHGTITLSAGCKRDRRWDTVNFLHHFECSAQACLLWSKSLWVSIVSLGIALEEAYCSVTDKCYARKPRHLIIFLTPECWLVYRAHGRITPITKHETHLHQYGTHCCGLTPIWYNATRRYCWLCPLPTAFVHDYWSRRIYAPICQCAQIHGPVRKLLPTKSVFHDLLHCPSQDGFYFSTRHSPWTQIVGWLWSHLAFSFRPTALLDGAVLIYQSVNYWSQIIRRPLWATQSP